MLKKISGVMSGDPLCLSLVIRSYLVAELRVVSNGGMGCRELKQLLLLLRQGDVIKRISPGVRRGTGVWTLFLRSCEMCVK